MYIRIHIYTHIYIYIYIYIKKTKKRNNTRLKQKKRITLDRTVSSRVNLLLVQEAREHQHEYYLKVK